MKSFLITATKLLVALGLIAWLAHSGKLQFTSLQVYWSEPKVLLGMIALWVFMFVMTGAYRWYLLLRGLDLDISYPKAIRYQLIGLFFNTAMPGAVGGDIVKAVYVIRDQETGRKTPAMLTILLDRIVGLVSLFVMGAMAFFMQSELLEQIPVLQGLALFVGAGIIAIFVGLIVVFYPFSEGRDPFLWLLSRRLPGLSILKNIYTALRSYRHRPGILASTLGLSLLIQTANLLFGFYLIQLLTGQHVDLGLFATVFPIATMATAIPLAPGGLGVGHVAFEKLFGMVNLAGGANVFNVMALGQLSLHLLGVIPYLMHRTRLPGPSQLETELAAEPKTVL